MGFVIKQKGEFQSEHTNFPDAWKKVNELAKLTSHVDDCFHIEDEDGHTYFLDGTGTGFALAKQSNKGTQFAGVNIYNQKDRVVLDIKQNISDESIEKLKKATNGMCKGPFKPLINGEK